MTTLAPQFSSALNNIEPGDDAKNAAQAHAEVSEALTSTSDFGSSGPIPSSSAPTGGTCPSAGLRTWTSSSG